MVISISTLDDLKKKTNESNKKALKKKKNVVTKQRYTTDKAIQQ